MRPLPRPALLQGLQAGFPREPRIAFVKSPVWSQASEETGKAFADLAERLGPVVEEFVLPAEFAQAHAVHKTKRGEDAKLLQVAQWPVRAAGREQ